jgi:hypothetical protein
MRSAEPIDMPPSAVGWICTLEPLVTGSAHAIFGYVSPERRHEPRCCASSPPGLALCTAAEGGAWPHASLSEEGTAPCTLPLEGLHAVA